MPVQGNHSLTSRQVDSATLGHRPAELPSRRLTDRDKVMSSERHYRPWCEERTPSSHYTSTLMPTSIYCEKAEQQDRLRHGTVASVGFLWRHNVPRKCDSEVRATPFFTISAQDGSMHCNGVFQMPRKTSLPSCIKSCLVAQFPFVIVIVSCNLLVVVIVSYVSLFSKPAQK